MRVLFTSNVRDKDKTYREIKTNLIFFFCSGADGSYWELLNDSTISTTGCEPSKFSFELCSTYSRILIKAPNGKYLRAEQNGSVQANVQNVQQATQWEF